MSVLILFLYDGNPSLLSSLYVGLFSLVIGILFTFYLPKIVNRYSEDNFTLCIAISVIGLVYMLIEILAATVIISSAWKSTFELKATSILSLGALLFLFGTWYMHLKGYQRARKDVLHSEQVKMETDLLSIPPFGGIISVYVAYTVVLFVLISVAGTTIDNWKGGNTPFPLLNVVIWLVGPILLGWYLARTLPHKYYSAKLQKIIALHDER
ncbi:hypothetical protein RU86_GL000458 [Lactococcus piscium]|uniref:Uncharacterized protein n=1 Tax=Pseudolactococcus piscium TaxID=1364 RepID=A0A2A5RXJ9_9LACT|nr:hypothetical protein [Lactococcus piscium]PCS05953.1 hypothetical protein RU86_GL000458 [Lactococcus piscium]